ANRFVAQFIGDSNIFTGRIDSARPGVVDLTGIGPVRVAQSGASVPSGDVDLMIRPERLRVIGETDGTENELEMTVDDIIHYGDSVLAIGTTHGRPLRARIVGRERDALRGGMTLKLGWAPTDAHILARA